MKLFTHEEKAAMIADAVEKINKGEVVEFVDASYCAYALCIGDLRDIGWSKKNVWRSGMNWTYLGPNSISVNGEIIKTYGETEEIDMDWS